MFKLVKTVPAVSKYYKRKDRTYALMYHGISNHHVTIYGNGCQEKSKKKICPNLFYLKKQITYRCMLEQLFSLKVLVIEICACFIMFYFLPPPFFLSKDPSKSCYLS